MSALKSKPAKATASTDPAPPIPHYFTRGDRSFLLRYLTPADLAPYLVFFRALDAETVRCRFGHLISSITDETAHRMVSVDPATEPALAIFDERETEICAIGRYYLDPVSHTAEIAIVVAKTMRRRGLARFTMRALIALARTREVRALHAYVMTIDAPILRLLDSLGFQRQKKTPEGEVQLTLSLANPDQISP